MNNPFFMNFSQLLDLPVIDAEGCRIGVFYDFSMSLNNDIYTRASGIIVRRGFWRRQYALLPISGVVLAGQQFRLTGQSVGPAFSSGRVECEFALRRDVLDQQVVDVENRKVVRVNDVHLLKVDHQFHIAHVDVGARALVRRLGWETAVDALVRFLFPRSDYLTLEELISWKNSQVLTLGSQKNVLKLDVARAKLAKIPPTELAEIMGDLDVFEQASLFRSLAFDVQLKVFADMTADDKVGLIEQLEDVEAVQLVSKIPSDEAADFLISLPKVRMHQLLRLMESQSSRRLRALLGFRKDSAGGLMATEYLSLRSDARVADAMAKVRGNVDYPGNLNTIYIVDQAGKYLGTTTIRRFINEPPERPVRETCHPQKVFVRTDDGMEEVALLLEQYKYYAIPVLDENDMLVGSITVDDVMEELIALAWGKYKDQL
jgi:CBS domain-containing protein